MLDIDVIDAQTTFQRTTGLNLYEGPYSVLPESDGYLIAGVTNSRGEGNYDIMLLKTDLNFNSVWCNTYGGSELDNPRVIIACNDGGYLLVGRTKSFGEGEEDVLVMKFGPGYGLEWAKTYGGPNSDEGFCAIELADGYLIGGSTQGGNGALAMKIDYSGNHIWSKTYGFDENSTEFFNVIYNDNGNYIFDTPFQSPTQGYNYMLVEISPAGNLVMAKSYTTTTFGSSDDYSRDLLMIPGDGYYILGHSYSFGNGSLDLHMIKTDLAGEVLWSKNYASPEDLWASQLLLTSNNELLLTCQSDLPDNLDNDIVVMSCDLSGNLIWAKSYGGNNLENQFLGNHETLREINGNLYALFGKTSSFGVGQEDIYIIGFDRDGEAPCNTFDYNITVTGPNLQDEDIALPVNDFSAVTNTITITPNPIVLVDSILCPLQPPPLALFTSTDTAICEGACVDFIDQSLQDPDQWRWYFEGAIPDTSSLSSPTGICYPDTGCFDVQLIVSNAGGPDTLLIEDYVCVYPYPEVFLGNDTNLCFTDTLHLQAPAGMASYLWNTGSTQSSIEVADAGDYWVRVETDIGCAESDTINVDFNSFIIIDLGEDETICEGDSIVLNAGNGFTSYQWQDGSSAKEFIVTTTGYYWVEVSDDLGCAGADTIYIEVAEIPIVSLGRDTLICEWESITLDGGNGFSQYLWQDGSSERHYPVSETGSYWVEVTDANACRGSDTVYVEVVEVPDLSIGDDTSFCEQFTLLLDAGPGWDDYTWQDGSNGSTYQASQYGTYYVIADVQGCADADTLTISEDCPSLIWFPNSFTPNGDGINESFKPVYDNVDVYQIRIFNRWGQLVFESNNINNGWDGKLNGELCPGGVYVFISEYTDNQKGVVNTVNGSVTLLR
ncbi:MAG TPA: gliding motility-associated C-terminal domain-containing protein [Bacteroidales bacterium]|nr:gliding motility-associated C-terminal domain-containing protein [Bacteroidales bacterium]